MNTPSVMVSWARRLMVDLPELVRVGIVSNDDVELLDEAMDPQEMLEIPASLKGDIIVGDTAKKVEAQVQDYRTAFGGHAVQINIDDALTL